MKNSEHSSNDDKTIITKKNIITPKNISNSNLINKCFNERYLIESQIGTGGMSDVYRAVDLHLKQAGVTEPFVAIKVLQTQFSDMPDAQQILINEALQTQKLSHPNIIRVYDVNSDGDYHFMVMEWLDGESLDQVVNSSKPLGISFEKTKTIITQIASALSYAHQEGLIHTDLKPSNIFLTRSGNIKIFDFGVARSLNLEDEYAIQDNASNTGLNGHTPAYASLEQLNEETTCEQDDIFAFSCIIYELLSSKHPYNRIAANKVNLQTSKLVKPKNISLYHWSSLKKGLALKKADRIEKVDELISMLSKRLFPKLTITFAIIAVSVLAGKTYYQQHENIKLLTNELQINNQQAIEVDSLLVLDASELLTKIDQIKLENNLIAQALLRQRQQELISVFEQKIEDAPTVGHGKYKNHAAVNKILKQGLEYYPDSLRLQEIQEQQETSRQAIITALIEKLDRLLIQGRYDEIGDNSVTTLLSDLSLLIPNEQYIATSEAFNLFEKKFNTALTNKNYNELNELIKTGELVFYNYKGAKEIIAFSKQMTSAVSELSKYAEDVKNSPDKAIFPKASAAIFYKKDIESLEKQLSEARSFNTYIAIDKKIAQFAKQFPVNFEPLVALQRQVASNLFTYANKLMEIKSFTKAKFLIKRGNTLLRDL
ncbi:serine/threonine-protein kinase [Psychromonas sp. SP041]|uniref:serine/threonine-protein kinase n=1 Tax=Psychromonas sp. SP041 TaxID=1365007 RepID=UPI0004078D3F|nr:serine/threonine-protein kinase [Psychromonas sp. SP041]